MKWVRKNAVFARFVLKKCSFRFRDYTMQAFLHDHAALLAGKRIALFASSGSSGIGTSERDAAALVPEALFEESLLLTSGSLGSMATRIPAWLEELGAGREEH